MARVLVVEDSADQARLIAGLLQAGGHDAEVVASGEAAIESMLSSQPDVVVTDLVLPGLSGLEVVERSNREFPHIPVILMTAFGSGDIAARALRHGAASYVPKRRLHDELLPTIRSTLAVAHARREQERVLQSLDRATYRFVLKNDESLIPPFVAFVQDGVRERTGQADDKTVMQIGIALHEALINAMHHGNLEVGSHLREGDGEVFRELIERRVDMEPYRDRRVHVTLELSSGEMDCVIRDEGPGFDPTDVPDPTDTDNLERVSGRGLYLICTFMDRVGHNESGNQITLVKRFGADEKQA